jgi:translation initiation factor 2 alpha subunit (eIF-2alpha)
MKHVAEIHHKRLEDLYKQFGWPLYKKFGHAYDAFKLAVQYITYSIFVVPLLSSLLTLI